jgi:hypothetical protein
MRVEKFNKTALVFHDPDELELPLRYSQSPSREVLIMFRIHDEAVEYPTTSILSQKDQQAPLWESSTQT